ncbi:MAG TPA: iron-sulfur cluster repair di-iron protein [Clostridia bacterium]|nr:iron-sulfur cluster repair di-iron protein [Clostridia bacterium]
MNNEWGNGTIGGIVAEIPAAGSVFKAFGIDYCCGGQRKLADVIAEQGVNRAELYSALDDEAAKARKNANITDLGSLSSETLSYYIESTHHSYLRKALPELGELFAAVLSAHGVNHPELFDLYRVFGGLRTELEQHLIKEEVSLFPKLASEYEDVSALAREIKAEHDSAGKALRELRRISGDYAVPSDGCPTYEKLFTQLERLEDDLHQHIHLENNILLVDL